MKRKLELTKLEESRKCGLCKSVQWQQIQWACGHTTCLKCTRTSIVKAMRPNCLGSSYKCRFKADLQHKFQIRVVSLRHISNYTSYSCLVPCPFSGCNSKSRQEDLSLDLSPAFAKVLAKESDAFGDAEACSHCSMCTRIKRSPCGVNLYPCPFSSPEDVTCPGLPICQNIEKNKIFKNHIPNCTKFVSCPFACSASLQLRHLFQHVDNHLVVANARLRKAAELPFSRRLRKAAKYKTNEGRSLFKSNEFLRSVDEKSGLVITHHTEVSNDAKINEHSSMSLYFTRSLVSYIDDCLMLRGESTSNNGSV